MPGVYIRLVPDKFVAGMGERKEAEAMPPPAEDQG